MKAKCAAIITSIILASAMAGCGMGNPANLEKASVESGTAGVSENGIGGDPESAAVVEQEASEQETEDNGFEFCLSREGIDPIYFNIPHEFNIENFLQQHMEYDGTCTNKDYYMIATTYMGDQNQYSSPDFPRIRGIDILEVETIGNEYGDIVDSTETPYGNVDIYYNFEGTSLAGSTGNEIQTAVLENNSKKIAIQITFSPNQYLDGEYCGEMKELLTYMFAPIEGINAVSRRMEFPNLTDKQIEMDDTSYDMLFGQVGKEREWLVYGANVTKLTDWSSSESGSKTDEKGREIFKEMKFYDKYDHQFDIVVDTRAGKWFDQQYLIENNRNGEYRIEEVREEDEATLRAGQVKIYYVKVLAKGDQMREQEVGILRNNGVNVFFALTLGEYDGHYDGSLKDILLSIE